LADDEHAVWEVVEDLRRPRLAPSQVQLEEGLRVDQARGTAAENDTEARGVLAGGVEPRALEGLAGRGDAHAVGPGHPPPLRRRQEAVGNLVDLGRGLRAVVGGVEQGERTDAAPTGQQPFPGLLQRRAEGGDRPHPRDDDAATH